MVNTLENEHSLIIFERKKTCVKTIDGNKVNILYRESPWIEENNSKETYYQLKGDLRPLNEYEKEPAMESFA